MWLRHFPSSRGCGEAARAGDWRPVSNFFGHLADEGDRNFAAGS
jgi:hypothetical protein